MTDFTPELDLIRSTQMSPLDQKLVENLFHQYLYEFWTKLKEPMLLPELNDLWWYTKVHFLARMTNQGDLTAKMMLEKELNRNASKLKNRNYEQTKVIWK